jgi:hypothetical protein
MRILNLAVQIIALFVIFSKAIYSQEINLNNPKIIDEIGIGGLKHQKEFLDKTAAGAFFLKKMYPIKWEEVKYNEFKFDKAISEADNQFLKLIDEYYQKYKNKEAILYLRINFGKYDFSKKGFPLELMGKNSYVAFEGDKFVERAELVFDNTDSFSNYLKMPPSKAEKFLEQRKDRYWGGYDRQLIAIYKYKIKEIKTPVSDVNSCPIHYSYCYLHTKIVGHIISIDIYDPKTKKIIYNIPKIQQK